jgi:hypothetical protein
VVNSREGDSILRGPRSSSFWVPRNRSHHIVRQASAPAIQCCLRLLVERRQVPNTGERRGKDDRKQNT